MLTVQLRCWRTTSCPVEEVVVKLKIRKKKKFQLCQSQRCQLRLFWYACGVLLVVLNSFPGLYSHVCKRCREAVASLVSVWYINIAWELGGNKCFFFLPEIFLSEWWVGGSIIQPERWLSEHLSKSKPPPFLSLACVDCRNLFTFSREICTSHKLLCRSISQS